MLTIAETLPTIPPRRTATLPRQIFATKSIDKLIRESERPEHALRKTLGPVSLTALGIGAVIGSGIFTVIGTAIGGNPAQNASLAESPVVDLVLGLWRRSVIRLDRRTLAGGGGQEFDGDRT